MKRRLKGIFFKLITILGIYYPIINWMAKLNIRSELVKWEKAGRPVPPPHVVKKNVLREYSKKYGL
jgi:hypothetical protein